MVHNDVLRSVRYMLDISDKASYAARTKSSRTSSTVW
jgi:uncharacterized protein YehS (DUF1456 family)